VKSEELKTERPMSAKTSLRRARRVLSFGP